MVSPTVLPRIERKAYDEAYFTRWYRDPRTRVHSPDAVRRKVRMVVGIAEYFLRRKVGSVLDIGAGEGAWRAELRRMRPSIRYMGIDPSEYVVRRHGRRRNIRLGSFEDLATMPLARNYDLVVCADVLQYIPNESVARGLTRIGSVLRGVAYLEAYTTADEMEGDLSGWHPRSRAQYQRAFDRAGLVGCGLHCFVPPHVAEQSVELELMNAPHTGRGREDRR